MRLDHTAHRINAKGWLLAAAVALTLMAVRAEAGWRTFGVPDGLAHASVRDMLEDRQGRIWFATAAGVTCYDGLNWTTFTTADGLPSNDVRAVAQAPNGSLWFGTWGGGVSHYEYGRWVTYNASSGLAGSDVSDVLVDQSGVIWVACHGAGVSRFDGTSWRTDTSAPSLLLPSVWSMAENPTGIIWFGTLGGGVGRYDHGLWSPVATAGGLPSGALVRAVFADSAGNVWFGGQDASTTSGFLVRYDGATWTTYGIADGLVGDEVLSIYRDRTGNRWFGGRRSVPDGLPGGVSRFDGASWRSYTIADGLAGGSVTAILQDRAGALWFATDSGVSRFDGEEWKNFRSKDGLVFDSVRAIYEARDGALWFGTFDSNGLGRGGVSRFDGKFWRNFTATDGLANNYVNTIFQDRDDNLWFGTLGGVSRYDGVNWSTYTSSDGLGWNNVVSIVQDSSGAMLFGTFDLSGGGNGRGVARFDGATWRSITTADGLAGNEVYCMVEDRTDNLWIGTNAGISRFDGATWHTYTTADGLAHDVATCAFEDRSGNLWFGSTLGVSRFDGATWRKYGTAEGLGGSSVRGIVEDERGALWFATGSGASRFDGTEWRTFGSADGLQNNDVLAIQVDRRGDLWFAYPGEGVTRFTPDRVPPRTIFLSAPPQLSSSQEFNAAFLGADNEVTGISFSYSLDNEPWSPWSRSGTWNRRYLTDGRHVLMVRARDFLGNVEAVPASVSFEIDTRPPDVNISSLFSGSVVRGTVTINGTAWDDRINTWDLAVFHTSESLFGGPVRDTVVQYLAGDAGRPRSGELATWDTTTLADGLYLVVLSASDLAGLYSQAVTAVIVDNHPPSAVVTAPAKVTAAAGGDIFTTNAELHLYFPPRAFSTDALVAIAAIDTADAPTDLPFGARRVLGGYWIGWQEYGSTSFARLQKPARFEMSLDGVLTPPGNLVVWRLAENDTGETWVRAGGTVDRKTRRIALTISDPGIYSLYSESSSPDLGGTLSGLAFTPRVFSPTGGFASSDVSISFTLGRPAPVTVRVYSRSGRLVREVVAGQAMNAGANLVRWDGRDRNGGFAVDGLYLVTVEALGRTERKSLAVVK